MVPFDDWLFKVPPESLEPILFAHPAARRVEASMLQELARRAETIGRLEAELAAGARDRETAEAAAAAREAALREEIAALQAPPELAAPAQPELDEVADLRVRVLAIAEG